MSHIALASSHSQKMSTSDSPLQCQSSVDNPNLRIRICSWMKSAARSNVIHANMRKMCTMFVSGNHKHPVAECYVVYCEEAQIDNDHLDMAEKM